MKELMIIITQTMMAIIDESVEVFLCFFYDDCYHFSVLGGEHHQVEV